MPREWTDEQRAEASRKAKAQGLGKKAAVVERSDLAFIAENEDRPMVETVERSTDEDGQAVKTTHTRPGTITMYKPLEHGGYEPRTASVTSIKLLLNEGWSENCPECHHKHIDAQGIESTDPNLCSAREPVAVILCPVCQVRIYDNMPFETGQPTEADENVITPDDLHESTPEMRLVAARNLHLWLHHPRSAQERNIPPLPEAMRDVVAEASQR